MGRLVGLNITATLFSALPEFYSECLPGQGAGMRQQIDSSHISTHFFSLSWSAAAVYTA